MKISYSIFSQMFATGSRSLNQIIRQYWGTLVLSCLVMLPYLLLFTLLGRWITCLSLSYYLNAEKVELLSDYSGAIFYGASLESKTTKIDQLELQLDWTVHWSYPSPLSIGGFSMRHANIMVNSENDQLDSLFAFDNQTLDAQPQWRLFKAASLLPALKLANVSIEDCCVVMGKKQLMIAYLELNDLQIEYCQGSLQINRSDQGIIPEAMYQQVLQQSQPEIMAWFLVFLENQLRTLRYCKNLATLSCRSFKMQLALSQTHLETQNYELLLESLESAPSHFQCERFLLQTDDWTLDSHGRLIFDQITPFQFTAQVVLRQFEDLPLSERLLGVINIQGNEQFASGFKIGGTLGKNLFQTFLLREYGLFLSDIDFCLRVPSSDRLRFMAHANNLETQKRMAFQCEGQRVKNFPWELTGEFNSQAPFSIQLKFLPYRILQSSALHIHPSLNFRYFHPSDDPTFSIGHLNLSGDLQINSGKISLNSMNFEKIVPEFIEEEMFLKDGYSDEELYEQVLLTQEQQHQKTHPWKSPKISFKEFTLNFTPNVQLFFAGCDAVLSGEFKLLGEIEELEIFGELQAKPLAEEASFGTVPISLKEATLSAHGKGIENIQLNMVLEALPNARGKQLPFESFVIQFSNNTFNISAKKRGSIVHVNLCSISLNESQSPLNFPSENLLPFLSIVLLGSLGDFVRGLVPLERVEHAIEEFATHFFARPNVQLIQPCMKDLNQLLLQLIIIDWDNWINLWVGVNFPLSGILEEKNVMIERNSNRLQVVLEWLFSTGCAISLEFLPALKVSGSCSIDLNQMI